MRTRASILWCVSGFFSFLFFAITLGNIGIPGYVLEYILPYNVFSYLLLPVVASAIIAVVFFLGGLVSKGAIPFQSFIRDRGFHRTFFPLMAAVSWGSFAGFWFLASSNTWLCAPSGAEYARMFTLGRIGVWGEVLTFFIGALILILSWRTFSADMSWSKKAILGILALLSVIGLVFLTYVAIALSLNLLIRFLTLGIVFLCV